MLKKRDRAELAKDTINRLVPQILKSNERARDGVQKTELVYYSPSLDPPKLPKGSKRAVDVDESTPSKSPSQSDSRPPRIKVIQSDTYDAAESVLKSTDTRARVGILNMCSSYQPGGGVLRGALAQEESLCCRSTLYAGLKDSFYRLPEEAAIYTPDVLVFKAADHTDRAKADWFFVDVISCAALRQPDLVFQDTQGERRLVYEFEKDEEIMMMKVRLILQIAKSKGITHLVLGALGCGAYRNPPVEVAGIFKKAILGSRKRAGVEGIEEIVFAIFDDGENLRVFREAFQGEVERVLY